MSCLYSVVLIGILFLLVGCARQHPVAVATPTEPDPLAEALARSARNIERLWGQLARLSPSPGSTAATASPAPRPAAPRNPVLQKRISLQWTGELRALVRHLAALIQYSFHERGARPALPIHTSLHVADTSVADILQEAGLQAGQRAGVRVHGGASRRLELVYTE